MSCATCKAPVADAKVIGAKVDFFHIETMPRLSIIAVAAILANAATSHLALAADAPYRVSLVGDGYDGTAWRTAVRVELDDGWKTYWRMPGEAGIPPDFTWTTSVPADIAVQFPLPGRYRDASGETVGYKHEVIFPVTVKAGTAAGVKLDLNLFFAVCKDVCIPAKATAAIELGSAIRDPDGVARVDSALALVPVSGTIARQAIVKIVNGKPELVLALDQKPDDIFIETSSSAYFRAPRISADGSEARLVVDNVADPAILKGLQIKITAAIGNQGLEQDLTLP